MSLRRVEFHDFDGPTVSIVNVPAWACLGCGAGRITNRVLRRLSRILCKAVEAAEAAGLRELQWTFTLTGPPELGGVPAEVKNFLSGISFRQLIAHERRLFDVTRLAAREPPEYLH